MKPTPLNILRGEEAEKAWAAMAANIESYWNTAIEAQNPPSHLNRQEKITWLRENKKEYLRELNKYWK